MAPRRRQTPEQPQDNPGPLPGDEAPPHDDTNHAPGQGDYNPFLKVSDIQPDDVFELTGWVRETVGRYGPQIVIELTQHRTGRTYDFGIGKGSPNHRTLFKRMGPNPFAWKGSIVLSVRASAHGGRNDFISVDQVNSETPPF